VFNLCSLWVVIVAAEHLRDGLNRFDGYQFKTFHHDSEDTRSISSDNVRDIFEAADGSLWFATVEGLNRYQREDHSFKRYLHHSGTENSLSHNNIHMIAQDKSGALWLGTRAWPI